MTYLINHTSGMHCASVFFDYEDLQVHFQERRATTPPDVVLMDFQLPGGHTGLDGLQLIQEQLPAVPIIMLTIRDDPDVIYNAFRAGASGFLLKNAPLDRLIDGIREGYRGGTLMPPGVAEKVLAFFQKSAPTTIYGLSERERQILRCMAEGSVQKQIADQLSVSPHTIDSHLRNIYRKLHVRNGNEAVAKAAREGLI